MRRKTANAKCSQFTSSPSPEKLPPASSRSTSIFRYLLIILTGSTIRFFPLQHRKFDNSGRSDLRRSRLSGLYHGRKDVARSPKYDISGCHCTRLFVSPRALGLRGAAGWRPLASVGGSTAGRSITGPYARHTGVTAISRFIAVPVWSLFTPFALLWRHLLCAGPRLSLEECGFPDIFSLAVEILQTFLEYSPKLFLNILEFSSTLLARHRSK